MKNSNKNKPYIELNSNKNDKFLKAYRFLYMQIKGLWIVIIYIII